jgi:hypothetical protein
MKMRSRWCGAPTSAALNRPAPKLSQDGFKAEGDMARDVFEEHPFRLAFADDACDLWPEMAGIVGAAPLASSAEGLAGISGKDDVEGTAEDPAIEAAEIIPDWGRDEIPDALGGDEDRSRPLLPFDKGAGVVTGLGEHEAQIQASAACAEGQSVPGT